LTKTIHIIAFDIPFPANYGGVIDVFYRVKALHELGVKITLHCFEYGKRTQQIDLEKYCEKVYYYQRKKLVVEFWLPYVVSSRKNASLLKNLQADNAPILFEAIHCCYFLNQPSLSHRIKLVRTHNIEHDYYKLLALSEKKIAKKLYFLAEAFLLKSFELKLHQANYILAISEKDRIQLNGIYGSKVQLIPAFHGNSNYKIIMGKGNFCFYHGKLSVSENQQAAIFLIEKVFNQSPYILKIAGDEFSPEIRNAASQNSNIHLLEGLTPIEIDKHIQEAHINILPTFQPTGIKLKLINVMFQGRFVLVNPQMVEGSGLEDACIIAKNNSEFIQKIDELMKQEFTTDLLLERAKIIGSEFDVLKNAQKIIQLLP
jgi:PAS domain-containing protein